MIKTPLEKVRKPRNKSSNANLGENLLRTPEKTENENFSDETLTEKSRKPRMRNEKTEKTEGNKGTQSTGDVLGSHFSVLGDSHSSVLISSR